MILKTAYGTIVSDEGAMKRLLCITRLGTELFFYIYIEPSHQHHITDPKLPVVQ